MKKHKIVAFILGIVFLISSFAGCSTPAESTNLSESTTSAKPTNPLENASVSLDAPVETEYGLVSGDYDATNELYSFLGIPYAAPPVGDLRWKAPQEPKPWDDVRECKTFGANELQDISMNKMMAEAMTAGNDGMFPYITMYTSPEEEYSEDCLYLNVWTPATTSDEKLPVVVYIHGGGMTTGSGSIPIYSGKGLAKKGVVFVSINYRLGVFGFFAHPDLTGEADYNASGNYGILDQVKGLEWVKNNIEAFGGDPNNVTIAGQSAGSRSVAIHTVSPLSSGLFSRAIAESSHIFTDNKTLVEAEAEGVEFMQNIGASSLEDLRSFSAQDLQDAAMEMFSGGAIVDGYVMSDTGYNLYHQNKQTTVPILLGSNKDESGFATVETKEEFIEDANSKYGENADKFLELYPATSDEEAMQSSIERETDERGWGMYHWADLMSQGSDVYFYYFDWTPTGAHNGAFHTAEMPYIYNNLDVLEEYSWQGVETDYKLADVSSDYMINFIKTGNPNGDSLPKWSKLNSSKDMVMQLGENIGMVENNKLAKYDFLVSYYSSLEK